MPGWTASQPHGKPHRRAPRSFGGHPSGETLGAKRRKVARQPVRGLGRLCRGLDRGFGRGFSTGVLARGLGTRGGESGAGELFSRHASPLRGKARRPALKMPTPFSIFRHPLSRRFLPRTSSPPSRPCPAAPCPGQVLLHTPVPATPLPRTSSPPTPPVPPLPLPWSGLPARAPVLPRLCPSWACLPRTPVLPILVQISLPRPAAPMPDWAFPSTPLPGWAPDKSERVRGPSPCVPGGRGRRAGSAVCGQR